MWGLTNNLALNAPATGFSLKGDNVVPTLLGLGVGGVAYANPLYGALAGAMLGAGRLANRLARSKALKRAYLNQGRAIHYQPSVIARSAIPATAKAAIAAISPTKKKKTIEKKSNS